MNLLDKEFLSDPVSAIKRIVSYTKQLGKPSSYEEIRAWLFSAYLAIDAKSGTDYAANFAKATNMTDNEQEKLRYEWCQQEEKVESRRVEFEKDPQWMGKEVIDWVICIQEQKDGQLTVPEDARVISAQKVTLNVNDFLKAMFLYVSKKQHGFICKASEFNQDSYKFNGTLRVFF